MPKKKLPEKLDSGPVKIITRTEREDELKREAKERMKQLVGLADHQEPKGIGEAWQDDLPKLPQ